jgi:ATP-dependent DNA helicase RecQ
VRPKRAPAATGSEDVRDAILRVVEEASPSVGRTRTVEILRGGRSKVVAKYCYDELPGYGEWHDWRAEELLSEVDAMLAAGTIRSTGGKFPKLELAA